MQLNTHKQSAFLPKHWNLSDIDNDKIIEEDVDFNEQSLPNVSEV